MSFKLDATAAAFGREQLTRLGAKEVEREAVKLYKKADAGKITYARGALAEFQDGAVYANWTPVKRAVFEKAFNELKDKGGRAMDAIARAAVASAKVGTSHADELCKEAAQALKGERDAIFGRLVDTITAKGDAGSPSIVIQLTRSANWPGWDAAQRNVAAFAEGWLRANGYSAATKYVQTIGTEPKYPLRRT